ncbi:MAG: ROK family protein, partial [Burkholderiaceae bacterium]
MTQRDMADVAMHESPAWSAWLDDAGIDGPVRAFAAVLSGQADSRSALSALLTVRSTTVSAWVAAMVAAGLVTETLEQPSGRGRPQARLVAHADRLTVQVLMVHSQSLYVVVVNLLGQVLWQASTPVASDADNTAMAGKLRALQRHASRNTPVDSVSAGVAFSISGLIDLGRSQWVFASRWPRIKNLYLPGCAVPAGRPVHVVRSMDAQLQARYLRREQVGPDRRTLLLHWGYGIGVAFGPAPHTGASSGHGSGHGSGEVGHWKLPGGRKRCRCGQVGCLETEAALWAIGPRLLGT